MLTVKRSLDLKRQWAISDFRVSLCQQEAEEATANERAKIVHSNKNLNTKVGCTKEVMAAKLNYRMAIQEARMTRCNWLQESETKYLKAISENAAMRSTWSTILHRKHMEYMHQLEEEALREETKSHHDFLSACQDVLHHAPQPLKGNLSTSYHILLGRLPSSFQSIPLTKTLQADKQPSAAASPSSEPKQSPWPKRQHSLADPWVSTSMDETSSKTSQEGPSSSKRREAPDWVTSLKPACADAFSHNSNPMKEARSHYFTTHPYDWVHGSFDDLSNIFKELAEGAGLLGKSIYEIQLLWDGLEKLKQSNYALQSLPKYLRFLRTVSANESPKVMGLKGIHDPEALQQFAGLTYCPWCGKEGQNEGTMVNHLRTTHYRLGLVCDQCFGCPMVTFDTLCQHRCYSCHK